MNAAADDAGRTETMRATGDEALATYEAILLVSFGGPEGPDEVVPFLENVLRGRNVPRTRLLEVAEHYKHFGGVSPINAQNRALVAALEAELVEHGIPLRVYWGNRNWHPLLADTVRQMADDGVRRALAVVTAAYSSYSSCRQYRENIVDAIAAVGPRAPQIDKVRVFYNHPGFIEAMVESLQLALAKVPAARRDETRVVFTAHSLPLAMAANCQYVEQLLEASRLVAEGAAAKHWQLAYQSRSGPPTQAWLEPDVGDFLAQIATKGIRDVVVAPIGFVSDHMEVVYDLDIEAQARARELGINMVRAATVGTHPAFVAMIRELILERLDSETQRRAVGRHGPSHDICPSDCCLPPARPAR
jgi:ferrochelatase